MIRGEQLMTEETIRQYVERCGITVDIVRDRGTQIENNWEHHAYILKLTNASTGATVETPWKQGLGIEDSPIDAPERVFDSLISDADSANEDFEDWADNYGFDTDSRHAYAMWELCRETQQALIAFLGGADELERVTAEVIRL